MRLARLSSLLLIALVASFAGAQQFTTVFPGTFVDISTTGGTAITGVGDDTAHTFVTTIGNQYFSAGSVTIGNNGAATAVAGGAVGFTNAAIPAAPAVPAGITSGAGILMPFWDDFYPQGSPTLSNNTLWYQETGGVLYMMWLNDNHYADPTAGGAGPGATFDIQVFNAAAGVCTPIVQYLYADTTFTTFVGGDNGVSATIGYSHGTLAAPGNAQYSYNTASVSAGTVLTLIEGTGGPFTLTASAPFGPGSLQLDWAHGFTCLGGSYFLAVTLAAGGYPNGWLYGVDLSLGELQNELGTGFPFLGPLNAAGAYTLGPFGAPSGLTFYAVSLGIPTGGPTPTIHTPAITFTVP